MKTERVYYRESTIMWKNYLKQGLKCLLYYSGILSLINKIIKNNGIYILMYHRISDTNDEYGHELLSVKKAELIKQIRFFKRNYCCISLPEAISILEGKDKLDDNYVVFTFDDGYIDNFIYGEPIFKEFDIHPTIFLTAGNVDTGEPIWTGVVDEILINCPNPSKCNEIFDIGIPKKKLNMNEAFNYSWMLKSVLTKMPQKDITKSIEEIKEKVRYTPSAKTELMDWGKVKSLANSGWTIGSHTMSHINLAIESEEIVTRELYDSFKLIENKTESKVHHFAYPFGMPQHISEYAVDIVKKYYNSAVMAVNGVNKCGDDLFMLKRVTMCNNQSLIDIKFKLLRLKLSDFHYRKINR
jgi:peptidoglycan/xylan/chitin deacetylase (PgdA/CDA1 family)